MRNVQSPPIDDHIAIDRNRFAPRPRSQLRAIMFTDIVGSVSLSARYGERVYRDLQARHVELFTDILARFDDAHIAQQLGDGLVVTFGTTADAVRAALLFQHTLRDDDRFVLPCPVTVTDAATGPSRRDGLERLAVRVGIHVGAMPVGTQSDLSGRIATSIASRVMSLACGGQTLVTRSVYDTAASVIEEHPTWADDDMQAEVRWERYGGYRFFGIDDDEYEIIEVGAEGLAPFRRPPDADKAWRVPTGFPRLLRWVSLGNDDATPQLRFNAATLNDYLHHAQLGDYLLVVLSGRDAGAAYQLDGRPPFVVGRMTSRSTPDIPVNDPFVSRRHFTLDWSADTHELYLSVLPGACPVLVNDRLVPPCNDDHESTQVRHRLRDGDRITIESTQLALLKLPRSPDFQAYIAKLAEQHGAADE